jgi:hypothetical protein
MGHFCDAMKRKTFIITLASLLPLRVIAQHAVPIISRRRPVLSLEEARKLIPASLRGAPVVLLACRGFFNKELGGQRNIYNSAFFVVKQDSIVGFRGNTLPSAYGYNDRLKRWYPVITPGVYKLKVGDYTSIVSGRKHPALTQASPINLVRDNGKTEIGVWRGVHVHSGPQEGGTGSWGCGTIPATEFAEFYQNFEVGSIVNYVLADSPAAK